MVDGGRREARAMGRKEERKAVEGVRRAAIVSVFVVVGTVVRVVCRKAVFRCTRFKILKRQGPCMQAATCELIRLLPGVPFLES